MKILLENIFIGFVFIGVVMLIVGIILAICVYNKNKKSRVVEDEIKLNTSDSGTEYQPLLLVLDTSQGRTTGVDHIVTGVNYIAIGQVETESNKKVRLSKKNEALRNIDKSGNESYGESAL